jgi:glycosyltransferase involved in cell wall biosynthesis
MKILVHSIYFPPEVGGLETHVLTLCQALQRCGHDITVVTSHSMKGTPKHENFEGVPVVRVYCPNKKLLGWVVTSFFAIPKMWKLSRNADIMHAHTFPSIVPCILPKKFRDKPLIATIHTSHFLRLAKKRFWRKVLKYLLNKPDIILTPSEEIKDISLSIAPEIDAYSLVNAVDINRFKLTKPVIIVKDNEKIIVVPRRLFEKNGVEFAVRALPIVCERFNAHLYLIGMVCERFDAHLYLIGDGPMRSRLEALAEELKLSDRVHFIGAQPNIRMPALLSSADVIVIPSLIEATSVAALESMACERVIVASNVGGLPEIVTDETGFLAEPANPNDLAGKIIKALCLSDEVRIEMGRIARQKVTQRWSTDALAEQVEQYYIKAIEKKSH